MRVQLTGVLSVAMVLFATAVQADTLRCGSSLITEGANQAYVIAKCGEPDSKAEISEPVYSRRPTDGFTYQSGTTTRQIWRYQRAPGKFPAVMTFEGGVLKKLEFEK